MSGLMLFLAAAYFAVSSLPATAEDKSPPAQFRLLKPEDGGSVANLVDPMAGPALQWGASADAESGIEHYEVWMDGKKVDEVPREMYVAYPQAYGRHTWKVVAVNGTGLRRESEQFTFTARTLAVVQDRQPDDRFMNKPVFTSIQHAADKAKPGDVILVYPGIYSEQVTVKVPRLTIKAAQYDESTRPDEPEILNAQERDYALKIEADGVTIQGLSIEGFLGTGLVIEGNDAIILKTSILGNRTGTGILVRDARNVSLRRNRLEALPNGIIIESGCVGISVQDNRIAAGDGILVRGKVGNVLIKHNPFEKNQRGIVVLQEGGHLPAGIAAHHNGLGGCVQWGLQVHGRAARAGQNGRVNAVNNWWGDAKGPSGQGSGRGSAVSDGVVFDPWLARYFEPTWESLAQDSVPEWYKDAKFGIYMCWTPCCVPAKRSGRYATMMYKPSLLTYHTDHYGHPSKFGFKDFIPMMTLEKWDPDRMAKLLRDSGAKFAGFTTEHHDGFAMWDSELSQWDSADMGPRRDVAGELARAVRKHGMKLVLSQHRVNLLSSWPPRGWYPRGNDFDTNNPKYWGLYFPPRRGQRSEEWLLDLTERLVEKVNKYRPAIMWMENGWDEKGHPISCSASTPAYFEDLKKAFVAEWYNKCDEWGIEPVLTYKQQRMYDYGVLDLEHKRMGELQPFWWQTDAHMGGGWFYDKQRSYYPVDKLVDDIVGRTSKRGITLLSFGPRADGTIAEPIKERLRGIGEWLRINGEAIYATRPWKIAQEGRRIRFTRTKSGDAVYVICLQWPGKELKVKSLAQGSDLCPEVIEKVTLLGSDEAVEWSRKAEALHVVMPKDRPCEHAYAFKVELSEAD